MSLLDDSIDMLRKHEPAGGYYGCFSGGKDSVVLKHVVELSGVNASWYYNKTTIDAPELLHFMRRAHADVKWIKPRHGNFFYRMVQKGHIPTRRIRWCCDEYKERRSPNGSVMLMGIRAEESASRKNTWDAFGVHKRTRRNVALPLLEWDSEYLWDFSRSEGLEQCELYAEGFKRLGCIGCPLTGRNRLIEFKRWPRFEHLWRRAFRLVFEKRAGSLQTDGREWFGSAHFDDWEQMWHWWLYDTGLPVKEQEMLPGMERGR